MNNIQGGYFTHSRIQSDILQNKDCKTANLPTEKDFEYLISTGYAAKKKMAQFSGSYYNLRLDQRLAHINSWPRNYNTPAWGAA